MSSLTDTKNRLLVEPFNGQRGPVFTNWAKGYLDAAAGRGDEDASYAECYLGTDPQAGLSNAQDKRRKTRRRESYSTLLQHITDESLKAVIRAEAGPSAANAADRMNGRTAWITIERECQEPMSALHVNSKILEFNALTMMKDVGVNESSIIEFSRICVDKNADLPAPNRVSDDALTEKLLMAVTMPPALAQTADALLQCPAANRDVRFYAQPVAAIGGGPAVPGGWHRRAVITYLDELWRAAFKRGELKFTSPTNRPARTGPSNRADGMVIEEITENAHAVGEYHHNRIEQLDDACAMAMAELVWDAYNGATVDALAAILEDLEPDVAMAVVAALEQELCCFNCFGLGHRAAECPSPKADRLQVADRITTLIQQIKDKRAKGRRGGPFTGKGNRGGRGWRGGRGRGYGRRGLPRPEPNASGMTAQQTNETASPEPPEMHAPNEAGSAAVTESEIDPFDIFGEPIDRVTSSDEARTSVGEPEPRAPYQRVIAACTGVAVIGIMMVMAISRKCLPSPGRLATILVVAGAQTGHALAPPLTRSPMYRAQAWMPSIATAAAMGAVAGSLLTQPFQAEPCFSLGGGNLLELATDFAFVGTNDIDNGLYGNLLIDSGATSHMVDNVNKLNGFPKMLPHKARNVRVANGSVIPATHVGTMDVKVTAKYRRKNKVDVKNTVMRLSEVLVVPGLNTDLFSCNAAFENDGIRSYFNDERYLELADGGRVHFADGGNTRKSLVSYHRACAANTTQHNDLVHPMLAHFSPDRLDLARARMQPGAQHIPSHSQLKHASHDCEPCALGGARKPDISHARPRQKYGISQFGDSVHVDLCGPFPPSVHSGFKYVIGFADRATREVHIYFLVQKTGDEVRSAIETFVADHGQIRQFVFDNGGEFTASTVDQLLNEITTSRRFSVPYTPQRNGLIERFWGTLLRQTRIVLAHSNHTHALWPFAMEHVVEIHNSLPTRALNPPMSPYEAHRGKLPSLKNFSRAVWGCDCVIMLPNPDKEATKLSPTGVKANYLGADVRRNGEYYFVPALNKVVTVVRAYQYFPTQFTPIVNAPTPPKVGSTSTIGNFQVVPVTLANANNPNLPTVTAIPINATPNQASMADPTEYINLALPTGAQVFSSSFVGDCFAVDADALVSRAMDAPVHHRDIIGRPDEAEWLKAEQLDFAAKMRNGAFEILDVSTIPPGTKTHKLKFAYVNKCDPITKDLIERRARIVAQGFTLREGIEYTEKANGTMRGSSVRSILCCAAIDDDDIFCGDVEKAFTQAPIDHLIYLEPPVGLPNMEGKVLKALMSVEGLPQSGWLFQNESHKQLLKQNGKQTIEPNIWIVPITIGSETISIKVGVWVDDFIICVPRGRRDLADKFWTDYRTRFRCKDLVENPRTFINIEIFRDRKNRTITLTQTGYINAMFDKFMHGSESKLWTKLWNTPIKDDEESLLAFSNLSPGTEEEQRKAINDGFMSIVGSILYASAMTRPDISFHTAFLAKLMMTPSAAALDAALGVVSYLKKTSKLGITYGPDETLKLYTDSSWGNENPRPMAGYATCYGGAALSWAAKALKIVPLSSAEAESAVFSLGCKDAMFVKQLLAEIRPQSTPQIIINGFIDNTAAITIIKSHGASGRTKHFERWITYVRDLYQRKIITITHLGTDEMPADIFTKPLPYLSYTRFRRILLGS